MGVVNGSEIDPLPVSISESLRNRFWEIEPCCELSRSVMTSGSEGLGGGTSSRRWGSVLGSAVELESDGTWSMKRRGNLRVRRVPGGSSNGSSNNGCGRASSSKSYCLPSSTSNRHVSIQIEQWIFEIMPWAVRLSLLYACNSRNSRESIFAPLHLCLWRVRALPVLELNFFWQSSHVYSDISRLWMSTEAKGFKIIRSRVES